MPDERPLSPATIAVTAGRPSEPGDPLNQPIVLASNFRCGRRLHPYARHRYLGCTRVSGRCAGGRTGDRVRQRDGGRVGDRLCVGAEGRRDPHVQLPRCAIPALRASSAGPRRAPPRRHHRHRTGDRRGCWRRRRVGGNADEPDARRRRSTGDRRGCTPSRRADGGRLDVRHAAPAAAARTWCSDRACTAAPSSSAVTAIC